MKIVAFTGAGISKESGVDTFRDKGGLWDSHSVEEVATLDGWKADKEKVLDFYNIRRNEMKTVEPNQAHILLAELEKYHDVTIITQNVDNLHERSGSTNILHLHGELCKSQSSKDSKLTYDCIEDINMGDMCEEGSQLRPHVVWFGEMPNNVEESYKALAECDLLLVIGTSLQITYTLTMLESIDEEKTSVIYIDPSPSMYLGHGLAPTPIEYIKKPATIGVKEVFDGLTSDMV